MTSCQMARLRQYCDNAGTIRYECLLGPKDGFPEGVHVMKFISHNDKPENIADTEWHKYFTHYDAAMQYALLISIIDNMELLIPEP